MNTLTDSTLSLSTNENGDFIYISQPQIVDNLYNEIVKSCDIVSNDINSPLKEDTSLQHNSSINYESIVLAETCDDSSENFVIYKIEDPALISKVRESASEKLSSKIDKGFLHSDNDFEGFRCHICSYLLPSSRTLRHHLVKCHDVKNTFSYFCPLCDHECWSEKQLNYHMCLHHGVKRTDMACNICGMQLSSRSEVRAHQRKHILCYQCPVCHKKFGAKHQLALHAQDHLSKMKPYTCSLCGRRFKHIKAFFLHEWRHEKQNCSENGCYDQFEDESYLLVHLLKAHKMSEQEQKSLVFAKDELDRNIDALFCHSFKKRIQEGLSAKLSAEENNPLLKFIIETEEEIFMESKNWKELKLKLQKNSLSFNFVFDLKCKLEKFILNSKSKDEKRNSEQERNLIELQNILYKKQPSHLCGFCNQSFGSSDQLNIHMNQHKKTHPCHICSRSFPSIKLLRKHGSLHLTRANTSNHSEKNNVVKCPECGKLFPNEKSLSRHNKLSHNQSSKYRCGVCEKSFTTKGHLNEHTLKFHKQNEANKLKKSVCPICDKSLASERNLAIHMQSHGDEDFTTVPQTNLTCPKCSKKFVREQLLLQHIVQHDAEHRCSVCDNVYTSACKLTSHLEFHDKELKRRFPCDVCDLKFSYKSQLRVHSLTHTGEKPFVCEVCGKRFKRLQQCKVHSNLVHSKKRVQCSECLKYFGTTSNLIRHRIAFHLNLKRWICGICSHSYAHSQDLRLHLKKIHQYELNSIDYKTKKSQGEIYIIPILNSYKISDDVKRKIEIVYREESEKWKELYRGTDREGRNRSHVVHANEREIPISSIINPNEEREIDGKIISYPVEIIQFGECSYCKAKTDNRTGGITCDICNAVVCSTVHLNMHQSEVHHIVFQCFSCNLKFPSKELCLNHIEKSHSHAQPPYQIDLHSSHLMSNPVNTGVPLLASVPQMRTVHILPPPNPVFQLVTMPSSDYGLMASFSGCQENAVVIQNNINKCLYQGVPLNSSIVITEQPNYEAVQISSRNQDKLMPQVTAATVKVNSHINVVANVANPLPLIDPSTEIINPSDSLSVAVASELPQLPGVVVEDQRQNLKLSARPISKGTEAPLQLMQGGEREQFENLNSVVNLCDTGNIKSFGVTGQQQETLITTNDIPNPSELQVINTPRDNASAANVLLTLAGLNHEGQETEFIIPHMNETCETSKINPPLFPLSETSKHVSLDNQITSSSSSSIAAFSCKGTVNVIPPNNVQPLENKGSIEWSGTQVLCNSRSDINIADVPKIVTKGSFEEKKRKEDHCIAPSYSCDPKTCKKSNDNDFTCDSSAVSFKCRSCDKVFLTLPQLERHNRVHDVKKFQCQICDKCFVEKFNLKTHMMIHTQERPRKCEKCGKKFRYFRDLKDHLRSHEGLLPFSCGSCSLKFLRRRDLIRHEKEQHAKVKYKCTECGREFKRKFYMEKVHMNSHRVESSSKNNSVACDHCEKIFHSKHALKTHDCGSMTHSFTCDVCEKIFSRKRSLTSHLKIHKKEIHVNF